VLPGVSYSTDVGGIALLNVFFKDRHPGRVSFMGIYTTRGSQWYTFQAVRPWKSAEVDVYLEYSLVDWLRYHPIDTEYHESLVEAMCAGVDTRLGMGFPLSESVKLGGIIGFRTYRFYDFEIEKDDHPLAAGLLNNARNSWVNLDETSLGIRITKDVRDSRYHTTRGFYTRLEYEVLQLTAGTHDYVFRATGDLRFAVPIWDIEEREVFPRMVWAQMASIGHIFSDVPDPVLFRIGGGETLRGFPWKRFEGRGKALYRNELRLTLVKDYNDPISRFRTRVSALPELRPDVEFAIFVDAGTVWFERCFQEKMQLGYGGGLRIVLPADVVGRADIAWSDDGHFWGMYFTLTQSF
jgi:outer membrane protein assembly factor BamA